jgi:hypothetical protein
MDWVMDSALWSSFATFHTFGSCAPAKMGTSLLGAQRAARIPRMEMRLKQISEPIDAARRLGGMAGVLAMTPEDNVLSGPLWFKRCL